MSGMFQIVGQSSGVSSLLAVDSSGRAVVRDADNITQTTAVNTKLTAIDAVLDNSLTQQTSVNANLAILETSNQAIKTAVEGTLAVSAPTITTSISTLANNVSVVDSATQTTASVDLGGVRTCAVFGDLSDGSANIKVEVSADDSVFYENSEQTIYISGTDYYRQMTIDARYIRLSYTNSSGAAQTWNAILSRKS
jgi:hypothetical protein